MPQIEFRAFPFNPLAEHVMIHTSGIATRVAFVIVVLISLARVSVASDANLIPNPQFRLSGNLAPDGWRNTSPRPQLAPEYTVVTGADGPGLSLHASRFEQLGSWQTLVHAIQPGSYYRFDVKHRAT